MNNKGMTLVELLVTFSLLLILVIGMFNLILEVKFQLDEKQIAKDLTEYSSVINNEIHYNLLRNKPFVIAYKNTTASSWKCITKSGDSCTPITETEGFKFKSPSDIQVGFSSNDLDKKYCQNIYPCAVYAYESGESISYKTIALNEAGSNSKDNDLLLKHGIYYNDVYESIPDQEFIEVRGEYIVNSDGTPIPNTRKKLEIKIENGLFIIDFPIYIIENDKNYGFKIAYPFFQPK